MRDTKFMTIDTFKDAEEYWLDKLSGELNEMKILADFPGSQTDEAKNIEFVLEGHLNDELVRISKNNDLSLYILLLCVLKILLFKYTEQTDIIAASPIYTPENREFNQCVVLRDKVTPDMVFKELLMNIKETVVGAYKKEYFPLKNLIAFLDVTNVSSLYRIVILLENIHNVNYIQHINTNLNFLFNSSNNGIKGKIKYNDLKYSKYLIDRIINHYFILLKQQL